MPFQLAVNGMKIDLQASKRKLSKEFAMLLKRIQFSKNWKKNTQEKYVMSWNRSFFVITVTGNASKADVWVRVVMKNALIVLTVN